MKNNLLVVDDEENVLYTIKEVLADECYDIYTASSVDEALAIISSTSIDVVLTDYSMYPRTGMELLFEIKKSYDNILVILLTAYGSEKLAVEAMKKGAYDYITKPFKNEELKLIIGKAFEYVALNRKNQELQKLLTEKTSFCGIIGESKKMLEIYEIIEKVAENDVTVLICGESGTGKELVANAIYAKSNRKKGKFIKINCAAIPSELLESELFGHKKGSFTGALADKVGKFQQADKGIIFLDEIGDMSFKLQAKLLRVLQEGEVEVVGGETLKVDVRVIAATNKDLIKEIENGNFREDLFYRLNVVTIELPPLRERKKDIPLLAHYFLKKAKSKFKKEIEGFTGDAMRKLIEYNWPGNVRELMNVIERAVVLSSEAHIDERFIVTQHVISTKAVDTFAQDALFALPYNEAKKVLIEGFEKQYIRNMLRLAKGNISKAAEKAGMYRPNFYQKMQKYRIKPEIYK